MPDECNKRHSILDQKQLDALHLAVGYTVEVEVCEGLPNPMDPVDTHELHELSEEEIQSLLSAGDELEKVEDLINDALAAKLLLRRILVSNGEERMNLDHVWLNRYRFNSARLISLLSTTISFVFMDMDISRLNKIGIVTLGDLCLLNEEGLKKAGFTYDDIGRFRSILRSLDLYLMG